MRQNILVMVMLSVIAMPLAADEKEDKAKGKGKNRQRGQNVASQLLKQLSDVGLSEEQTEKIKAAGQSVNTEMAKIRSEAGITPELMKKRAEATKSLADSDKKGKERAAAIDEAAGLSKPQIEAMNKLNAVRMKYVRTVVAMLTDEQKEKLPKQLARAAQPEKKREKGNKPKKKDAA